MIFWYPGEAGTTSDAQPTIDAFFDYINKQIAPDKILGKYFNSVPDGLKFINRSKPRFGILSLAAYTINSNKLGKPSVILSTLPLPHGTATEQYVIVGKGARPANWNTPLYSKQPLTKEFAIKYILNPNLNPQSLILNPVSSILPLLKDLSSGTKQGAAILQPIEYYTLKNMNQPWTSALVVWHTSPPMSSAPLVAFGDVNPAFIQKLKDILLKMNQVPEGKEILESLRLKGFGDINPLHQ